MEGQTAFTKCSRRLKISELNYKYKIIHEVKKQTSFQVSVKIIQEIIHNGINLHLT